MKLAILTQYYPPEVGAPQARLSELAANFLRRGHQVTILTAMPNYPIGQTYPGYGGLYQKEEREGVQVIRTFIYPTQSTGIIRRLTNYFSFIVSSSVFGSFLLRSPDYLLVESPPLFLGLAGLWLSWLKRTRLIFNVSDLWPESVVQLGVLRKNGLAHRLSTRLEAFCYGRAAFVTGQSKSILANIIERFPDRRTFHLSNGVDTKRFAPELCTRAARSKLSNTGSYVALYAGLHGLAQGLEQVLDSAAVLRHETAIKFAFLGDGPEKKKLIKEAQARGINNINFLDLCSADEVPALLASADVALVTLKAPIPGAVPSKLYEAMACGLPVVLVADGEAVEIMQQHNAGIAVTPGDVGTLVEALRTLFTDPILRRTLGENGRRAAQEHFDRTTISNRFIDYLEADLSATPNSA